MKIFFIAPHLSTGGMPQYLFKQIESLYQEHEVYCIEWDDVTGGKLVVQRNRIKDILGNRLITLDPDKHHLFKLIEEFNPEVVHLQEIPEMFMPTDVADKFYSTDRKYKIVETSHDSSFDIKRKNYFPDKFMMVSQYQVETYKPLNIPIELVEYPIEYKKRTHTREELLNKLGLDPNKKHVINVGLFTPRKNQAEVIEYARALKDYPIQFHFIGNQADNFQQYWQPLMKDFPSNCKWWGERSDVDTFFEMGDLFLFTSRGHATDKETMPLVIREAISWKIPSLIFNLDVYLNYFNKFNNIDYLDFNNKELNKQKILNKLNIQMNKVDEVFNIWIEPNDNKIHIEYKKQERVEYKISIRDKESRAPMYWFNSTFENYSACWTVPIPQDAINFASNSNVGTITVEFYDHQNNLIFSKDVFIKHINIKKLQLNLDNPFDCLFNNYNEMFLENKYDCYEMDNMDIVFDLGANSGLFSLLAINKGAKKVYAFEPNEESLINLNSLTKGLNVEVIPKAVYTKDENLKFYIDPSNTTIGSLSKNHLDLHGMSSKEITVPAISLKTFVQQNKIEKISLLKMDIEGAEYEIIDNLEDEVYDIVDNFLIEYHDNDDERVLKLTKKLFDKGFDLDQIRDQNSKGNIDIKESYHKSPIGTILAKKRSLKSKLKPYQNSESLDKVNPVIIVDAFFHNENCLDTFKKHLSLIKNLNIPIMLVTNSKFEQSLIDEVDYIFYDSNNRLFSKDYSTNDKVFLWYGDSIKYFSIGDKITQKHGLSVLSNLYHSTNLAKSLGFTHFFRFEYDSYFYNLDKIKEIIASVKNQQKKGYTYLNEDKYISFQLWYFDLHYFTNMFPILNNENDYIKIKKELGVEENKFLTAEEFTFSLIKKYDKDSIIIKKADEMNKDFPDASWNSITSPAESSKIKDGFISSVFKVGNKTEGVHEQYCPVNENKFAIITWNCSSPNENESHIIIKRKDGSEQIIYHSISGDNGHKIEVLPLDDSDVKVQIKTKSHTQELTINKNNIHSVDNIVVFR